MKILVTGATGQLGYDIVRECRKRNIDVIGVGSKQLDITNKIDVDKFFLTESFDAIIHCAAWTAVDLAEDNEEQCRKVNVLGTQNLADICEHLDIPLMYFSTDYVFNGKGDIPWKETDITSPINVYGQTKLEGELIVQKLKKFFILRISWVFGVNGNNFVKTMLRLAKERKELTVVSDQIGSPTYTYDLSKLTIDMISTTKYGIYHATNTGFCSWYEFACEIFKQANINIKVIPVSSNEYITKAKRPKNSKLDLKNLKAQNFNLLPDWRLAVKHYLGEFYNK